MGVGSLFVLTNGRQRQLFEFECEGRGVARVSSRGDLNSSGGHGLSRDDDITIVARDSCKEAAGAAQRALQPHSSPREQNPILRSVIQYFNHLRALCLVAEGAFLNELVARFSLISLCLKLGDAALGVPRCNCGLHPWYWRPMTSGKHNFRCHEYRPDQKHPERSLSIRQTPAFKSVMLLFDLSGRVDGTLQPLFIIADWIA